MLKRTSFVLMAVLATLVGLYPSIYFVMDRKFGLLQSKTESLLSDISWNTGFYTHIICSGIALLSGWLQFNKRIRDRKISFHRMMGRIYILSVIAGSLSGIYIALFATAGIIATLGFVCLGLIWFCTTLSAYWFIRHGNTARHQVMMTYSYAACFAAVTLRIWLPLLVQLTGDFNTAYRLVAWLCWVPNMIFAKYILLSSRLQTRSETSN
jgi:uncharacterized membrane protein